MSKDLMLQERNRRSDVAGARRRLLEGIPVSERTLELGGVSTAVLEGGRGDPVVLLHGPGEHAAKWAGVLPGLVATHRVIAPDLPGHGASPADGDWVTPDHVLGWLEDLIHRTCASPPVLVGQTVGGAMAARFAAGHGDRIARLVLVDALCLAPFQPAPEFASALTAYLAGPNQGTFESLWRQCAYDFDRLRDSIGERWETFAAYTLGTSLDPRAEAAQGALMQHFGFAAIPSHDLAGIAVPTVLIWGRHDLATNVAVAEAASERYGWPLEVIEDAGTDPAMEQPERFLEALRRALT
jgi:pimeloyl-ACP methyl ester carboxylesterase